MSDRHFLAKRSRFLQRAKQRRLQRMRQLKDVQTMDQDIQQLLSRCAVDLRARLSNDDIQPTYEREEEVSALVKLLHSGAAPIILGRTRAGKTALVYALARRIINKDVPPEMRDVVIYEVSPSSLVSGLQFGEGWRANVAELFSKLNDMGSVLIFFRDLHTAIGAGVRGGDDEEDDLAAALEAGLRNRNIFIVGEARPDRWQVIAADRDSFVESFTSFPLPDFDTAGVLKVLEQVAQYHSAHFNIAIAPNTLETIFDISQRFVLNQAFPGKAVELLQDTLHTVQRVGDSVATASHVVECFSARTGLTRLLLDDREPFDEAAIQRGFSERVLGQEPAVAAMVQKLALLKARMHDPSRPMGVYLFLGPTGVGKTELARTLAAVLFGGEDRFVRFNMADYGGDFDYAQLFGRSWGDTDAERRGKFTMALINMPFAVLLLDEFEKAHPSIFNRFLQLFDEGLLVNAMGEEVNLRNTIIIMTSNFGASIVQGESWGFMAREGIEAVERRVLRETEAFFSPEFINRLDGVTFFKPLSQSDMRRIAARELKKLFEREGLRRRQIQVELDDAVLNVLLKHGYSIRYGARYLKRQIEKMVSYPLASTLLKAPERDEGLLRLYTSREHIKAAWVDEDDEPLPLPEQAAHIAELPTTTEAAATWLEQLYERLNTLTEGLDLLQAKERQDELLEDMAAPAFWDNPGAAQQQLLELSDVARRVDRCHDLLHLYDQSFQLFEKVQNGDRQNFPEVVRLAWRLEQQLRLTELELLFHDPEDWHDAIMVFEHSSGAGVQWVHQLVQTYLAWAEKHDIDTIVIDETAADDLHPRVSVRFNGSGSFGLLRSEAGTHRISEREETTPAQRQITQITVQVLPVPGDDIPPLAKLDLDLSVHQVLAEGRWIRRLRCAARATHVPSGLAAMVISNNERQARQNALLILQARLIAAHLQSRLQVENEAWGSVVRTYSFGKRAYVKDPRTGISTNNPRDVLEGQLDMFIEAALGHIEVDKELQ